MPDSTQPDGATIAIVVIISILVLGLVIALVVQAVNRGIIPNPMAEEVSDMRREHECRMAKAAQPHQHVQHQQHAPQPQQHAPQPQQKRVRLNENEKNQPSGQLNLASMSDDSFLQGLPTSNVVGDFGADYNTTEFQGVSANPFTDGSYIEDPTQVVPSATGLSSFMPNMADGGDDGSGSLIDPTSGIPLFTVSKLIQANQMGSASSAGFLRRVQDPESGLRKTVGRNLTGTLNQRSDLDVRRKQFNADRLSNPDGSDGGVMWNINDHIYQ